MPHYLRRCLQIVTFCLAPVTAFSFGQTATLGLSSGSAAPGGTVSLNLLLSGGGQPAGLQWTLTYAPADFTGVSVVAASSASSATKTLDCAGGSGVYSCLLNGLNATTLGDGVVATATFTLSGSSTLNRPVQLTAMGTSKDAISIAVTTTNGLVTTLLPTITPNQVQCSPATVITPGTTSCTVTMTGPAPSGGIAVALASDKPTVTVPGSVTVAAGATTASFAASAASLTADSTAVLTAAANGASASFNLSLVGAPMLSSLTCGPTTLNPGGMSTCTVVLTKTAPSGGSTVALSDTSSYLTVPSSVVVSAGSSTGSFTATADAFTSAQTAVITAALNGSSKTSSLSLTPAATCPCSIWAPSAVPTIISSSDTSNVELGMRFQSKVAGYVLAVRFYKGPTNTGTHPVRLWTSSGTRLASTYSASSETASGWQQINFKTPVAIAANTTYVVSYRAPYGRYSADPNFFKTAGVENGPLYALRDGEEGGNGLYKYGTTVFPTNTYQSTNYWVDVVFNTVASSTPTAVPYGTSLPGEWAPSSTDSTGLASETASSKSDKSETFSGASLACSPRMVRAGGSFTCELRRNTDTTLASATVTSTSSDVQLPLSVNSRAGRRSIMFHGNVQESAEHSLAVVTATVGNTSVEERITILPSLDPIMSTPKTAFAKYGEPISFFVSAKDASGLPLPVTYSDLPPGAIFHQESNRFEWTPAPGQEGEHSVAFAATNSAGFSKTEQTRITVGSGAPILDKSTRIACSPGSIATLRGAWLTLSSDEHSDSTALSFSLGGTAVRVNGSVAPVLYAGPDRVDFQCPVLPSGTPLSVALETAAGSTHSVASTMLEALPTILGADDRHQGQGAITINDTGRTATLRTFDSEGEPARPGDVVSIRIMGLGATIPESIFVKIGDLDAKVLSMKPTLDQAGVVNIRVRVPDAVAPSDAVPVVIELISSSGHRFTTNSVTMAIE